jgi:hypothetical protein
MLNVEQLEALCGYEFDESDRSRADAVINFVETAAEGVIGSPLDLLVNEAGVKAVCISAALRMMQNKGGVATETIGGFTAQYPTSGRIFTPEESLLLRRNQAGSVGTVKIRNPYKSSME